MLKYNLKYINSFKNKLPKILPFKLCMNIKLNIRNFSTRDQYNMDSDIKRKLQEKFDIKQGLKKTQEAGAERFSIRLDVHLS